MDKRQLNIYSVSYPFGNREEFIKNELPVLLKHFSRINLLPLFENGELQEIPENVYIKSVMQDCERVKLKVSDYILVAAIGLEEFTSGPLRKKLSFLKKVREVFARAKIGVKRAKRIEKLLKEDPDLLNAIHYSFWFQDWAVVLSILKKKGIINDYVARAHGFDVFDERWPLNYMPLKSFQLNYIDKLCLVSKAAFDYMSNKYRSQRELFFLSHLGTATPNNFVKETEIRRHVFTIVSCANVIPLKRVLLIPEILKSLNFPVSWIHFGDGLEFEKLKRAVSDLPSNIQVDLKGRVSNEYVHDFYSKNFVDVCLLLTCSEGGVPVSLQEAASYGIPLIASNAGGVSEIVNSETGVLLDINFSKNEVASVLSKMYTKELVFDREKITLFWRSNFSSEKNYESFAKSFLLSDN